MADALVFLCGLDYATRQGIDRVLFVSSNTDDFSEDLQLHPDLQGLSASVIVEYFTDVGPALNVIREGLVSTETIGVIEAVRAVRRAQQLIKKDQELLYRLRVDAARQAERYDAMLEHFGSVATEQTQHYDAVLNETARVAVKRAEQYNELLETLASAASKQRERYDALIEQTADLTMKRLTRLDEILEAALSAAARQGDEYNRLGRNLQSAAAKEAEKYNRLLEAIAADARSYLERLEAGSGDRPTDREPD